MQQLLAKFVTVADEVGRLQRGGDAECDLFRGFCEEGHYGGRTAPTNTRQGIYAVAPSGRFLASVNTTDPTRMARMLETALARWAELSPTERGLDRTARERLAGTSRFEDRYPTDGLVLAEYLRDLEPAADTGGDDWRAAAWNEDQVWFTRAEGAALVPPAPLAVGARCDVPVRLVRRLARLHLVDSVRGQTPAFGRDDVEVAELTSECVAIDGERVTLRLAGRTRVRGQRGGHDRGVATELTGRAEYDVATGSFTAFELLAVGERWGATQYNERPEATDPTRIGFAFVLAPADHPRVAPAFWWQYDLR
ncbi:MAG: hypothetical protein KDE27_22470 [Planctomycetes bacterium]|nr:hypothetical protein [Planctomycetota bacterium]